ncbi:MAG: DUF2938 domain-containing protein [Proteobacteria bacterium]|nr:DUF2938 domain-containing protein [Pseudomonadota bacterium]
MDALQEYTVYALMTGVGATLVMDIWGVLAARRFKFPPPNYALVGRWIGHMPRGRFFHAAIAQSPPVAGERFIGWLAHYSIGVLFAALLLTVYGPAWARDPTLPPALVIGLATLAAPFLLMQPGMGAGLAAARTPNPARARFRSVLTHTAFGFGLYGAALVARAVLS